MQNQIKYKKVLGAVLSMAFVSTIIFIFALLRTEPAHAAETLSYAGVTIEGDTLVAPTIAYVITRDDAKWSGIVPSISTNDVMRVKNQDDLDFFAKSIMASDDSISKVDIEDETITIYHKEPAKFLGFIPSRIDARISVNTDGDVAIKYPWYTLLSTKNGANLKAEIKAKVGSVVGTSTPLFSPRELAELIHAVTTTAK